MKNNIIDIDAEFEDIKFDEVLINRSQSAFTKRGNKQFSETMKAIAAQRDEKYYLALQQGLAQRDNTYQAQSNADPATRKKISDTLKGRKKTQEHLTKVAEKNKQRSRPCKTPFGIFASGTEAGLAYNQLHGSTNGKNAVCRALKKGKPGYEYITFEEYKKLTNNT